MFSQQNDNENIGVEMILDIILTGLGLKLILNQTDLKRI